MTSRINTLTFSGIDIIDVDVQIYMASGMPSFTIVGLPDKTIAESRERVRAALGSMGLHLPAKKITVNLSPADLVKEGSHFDLAIACGLLSAMQILPEEELVNYLILGELALDGVLTSVNGVLPAAIGAAAREKGIICPAANGSEAAWSGNRNILAPQNLLSLINHFKGTQILVAPLITPFNDDIAHPDIYDVKGQEIAKRALLIAACGGHNMLMSGPPGAGKSMLAKRLSGILPKMSSKEVLECSMIASIAGNLVDGKLQTIRPFRAPHHSCSMAAMVGGGIGKRLSPGEISLAHNGVLFLDELPEFPRGVLDSLRQPTETGEILVSRSGNHVTFPAKFQLIAAMNPCRCGYLSDPSRSCNKAPTCGVDYQAKISGPILDRIDLHVDMPGLKPNDLEVKENSKSSSDIIGQVEQVRDVQASRYQGYGISLNSELDGKLLVEQAMPYDEGKELLNESVDKLKLSMRGYNRILRVARTIADIEGSNNVKKIHIAEALSYRQILIKK
jgi:magnesium chelatase family protein